MGQLSGKTAVVTGGASGIGLAAVKSFLSQDANVVAVDRSAELLERVEKTIGSDRLLCCVADVSQPAEAKRYVANAVERFGGVDVYVANAGVLGVVAPVEEYPLETFDAVMAVNVRGVWLGLKYVVPEMKKRGGGSIVLTSSIAGVKGFPGVSPYCASKHALVGIMRSVAIECAGAGIRVNTVHPGPIETAMIHELEAGFSPADPSQGHQLLESGTLLKRYGSPDEVAGLMLFLTSEEGRYCTGGIYMIDGGMAVA